MMRSTIFSFIWTLCVPFLTFRARGFEIPDTSDLENVKSVAANVAWNLASYYVANETDVATSVGMLPDPYMWWLAGAMWKTLIEYWSLTGDDTYNELATQAMLAQMGEDEDFEPSYIVHQLGNDDQAFWAFAVLAAVEQGLPDPPEPYPGWLTLAQAVFNRQRGRWNTEMCGGGLQWQISTLNPGYGYKNTISTGTFMQIAARLYRYTEEPIYGEWADRAYQWMSQDMIYPLISERYQVFDGSDGYKNCTDMNHIEWTYNIGTVLASCAYMYDVTQSPLWQERIEGLVNHVEQFFPNGDGTHDGSVMVEMACERIGTCNDHDQRSFKGYLSRDLAMTMQLAPFIADRIRPKLFSSGQGAARQCSGGPRGDICGMFWNQSAFDGVENAGAQIAALSAVQNILIDTVPTPIKEATGGISRGNPDAGTGIVKPELYEIQVPLGDRVAAGFLTFFLLVATIGMTVWMIRAD